MVENPIGRMIYFTIITLSHMAFGIFSTEHRFPKPVVYIGYLIFGAIFLGISSIPDLKYILIFLITLPIYILIYLTLSKGSIFKNLFAITSYLTYVIILFGVTFMYVFIDCNHYLLLRWILIILTVIMLEVLLYKFLIPNFRIAAENIKKGWVWFLCGDFLFVLLLFMQIFYPFHLKKDEPWPMVLFILSSILYMFTFSVVFKGFATTISYNKTKLINNKLEKLAHIDSLTSLYNKNYLDEYLEALNKSEIKEEETLVIVVMDVNKFKLINDTYGHIKGDEVLKTIGNKISNVFNESSYKCFRYGGDEFVVIGKSVQEDELKNKINALHEDIKNCCTLDVSVGYSYVNHSEVNAFMTALKNADKIMYQNKLK